MENKKSKSIQYFYFFFTFIGPQIVISIYTTKTGNIYYFVYDQGYLAVENENYVLVKK
jgi:hypothetical protein